MGYATPGKKDWGAGLINWKARRTRNKREIGQKSIMGTTRKEKIAHSGGKGRKGGGE